MAKIAFTEVTLIFLLTFKTSYPSTITDPLSGSKSPQSILISVVLPDPLGPAIP